MSFFIKTILPAAGLFMLGLWMGTHRQPFLGLIGFLSCFVVAVALVIEGGSSRKKR